jgi:5-methylcytosine-specific restriction endonuclease McrA
MGTRNRGWRKEPSWKILIRQKRSVRIRRAKLIALLGGKCVLCGTDEKLEFDHYPNGRTRNIVKVCQLTCIQRYEKEYKEGKLRLLCSDCNKRNPPLFQAEPDVEEVPF